MAFVPMQHRKIRTDNGLQTKRRTPGTDVARTASPAPQFETCRCCTWNCLHGSSLGMFSLTRGSTLRRKMKSPVIDQKPFLAPASSHVESACCGDEEESPPDSPRRISCSSPRSRQSRVKVDVLRRCSLPKTLTVPSATGNLKFPLFLQR